MFYQDRSTPARLVRLSLLALASTAVHPVASAQVLRIDASKSLEPALITLERENAGFTDSVLDGELLVPLEVGEAFVSESEIETTELCSAANEFGGVQVVVGTGATVYQVNCESSYNYITGNPANATRNIDVDLTIKDNCPYTASAVFYLDAQGNRLGHWTIPADGNLHRNTATLRPGDYLELDCYGNGPNGRGCQFQFTIR